MEFKANHLKKQYFAVAFIGIAGVTSTALSYIPTTTIDDDSLTPRSDLNRAIYKGKIERTPKTEIATILEIDLHQNNKLIFKDKDRHSNYASYLKITEASFAQYGKQSVPEDLRQAAFFAQQITGIPHDVIFMIAKAESNFDGASSNSYSTGQGYFHMLKDTALAYIENTKGTPLEHLFPLSNLIKKGKYKDGRTKMYMVNEQTGEEDKALTYSYHKQVANNPYLSAILTGLKVAKDTKSLSKLGIEPSYIDTYAQWFFGGSAGKRFASLRKSEPNAPIWRIYGNNQAEVEAKYKNEIGNKGNNDFFFAEDGEYNTITQNANYLINQRDIPNITYNSLEIDTLIASNMRIQNPQDTLPTLIAERNKANQATKTNIAILEP